MSPPTILPLSTTFANCIPSHPLPSLLLEPVTPRLALIEATLLASPPGRILARLGLGPKAIVLLAVAGLARLGSKYRAQWRALLGLLGVAEALGRTVGLLDALERRTGEEEPIGKGKGRAGGGALKDEAKYVLSWWILYALVVVAEGVHPNKLPSLALPTLPTVDWRRLTTTSAAASLANLVSDLTTALRRRLIPLLARFPALALRFPQLLFPAHPAARARASARRFYPQPRPYSAYTLGGTPLPPSLPVALLGGEVRWELARLVVLWLGLRRDGFGASAIWDWLIGPVCAVAGARWVRKGRRVVKVIEADDEDRETQAGATPPLRLNLATVPIDGPDVFNLDSPHSPPSPHLSPFSDSQSHNSSRLEHQSTPTFGHSHGRSFASDAHSDEDGEASPSPGSPVVAGGSAGQGHGLGFPTPNNVPYKMASSRQPLRSAAGSFHGSSSAASADGASSVGGAGRGAGLYDEEGGW